MSSTALVTLAIGDSYRRRWRELCEPNWRAYAERHGYDVICLDRALDTSERARSRSPAWQKCLVASQPFAEGYERLVWMDADVLINPDAPAITDGVPLDRVGAVDEFATPSREEHALTLAKLFRHWEARKYPFVRNATGREYHAAAGLPADFDEVVQTGVMVLSPEHHAELFERVYAEHEDQPGLNYEMRPLSWELLTAGIVHWIDPRFNYIWGSYKAQHFPYLLNHPEHPDVRDGVARALSEAFCLHFCGAPDEMRYAPSGSVSASRPARSRRRARRGLRTPVAISLFRRADTAELVLDAVREVRPERLLVFADGPRADVPSDDADCAAARAILDSVDWDCEVATNFADTNLGLRERMISGLDWVFDEAEEAIVLEDDTVPDPSFFWFCQELLDRYRDEPRVMSISGNDFRGDLKGADWSYRFSRYQLIWGWATWRRAWELNQPDLAEWPQLREAGWLDGVLGDQRASAYWTHLFDRAYDGMDTWDYGWGFSCWRNGGLAALPTTNLVSNLGFRSDATHTRVAEGNESPFAALPTAPMDLPLRHPEGADRDTAHDAFLEDVAFSGNLGRMFDQLRAVRRAREAAR